MARLQHCPCGSGKFPNANYDARGIFLCYSCAKCHREKMRGYRREVLTNPNYEADDLGDEAEAQEDERQEGGRNDG